MTGVPLVARPAAADDRARPDDHPRRIRGAGGDDRDADRRPRPRRPRAVRLGLLRLLPRLAHRDLGRRRPDRRARHRPPLRRRARPVRDRPPDLRVGAVDGDDRRGAVHPGTRWRRGPAGGVRRDRTEHARRAPPANVRHPLRRLGPTRGVRARDRRVRGRDLALAAGLPRPPAADPRLGLDRPRRDAGDPGSAWLPMVRPERLPPSTAERPHARIGVGDTDGPWPSRSGRRC